MIAALLAFFVSGIIPPTHAVTPPRGSGLGQTALNRVEIEDELTDKHPVQVWSS